MRVRPDRDWHCADTCNRQPLGVTCSASTASASLGQQDRQHAQGGDRLAAFTAESELCVWFDYGDFYVFAVIATNMFGSKFPDLFGDLGTTMFTLFQVMTLESWSEGVARPVMEIFPHAWLFFVIFIFIATFVIINLFIAVIVDSLNSSKQAGQPKPEEVVLAELRILRDELAELRHQVGDRR